MAAIKDFDTVLVPMQLEAFVLNPAVCGSGDKDDKGARISPITQPNYTFLRLDNFLIQNDVQNHSDLHSTAPADVNSRMTDLGARPPKPLRHRHGVYLHWTLPRLYRAGTSSGDSVPEERRREERLKRGLDSSDAESTTPQFVDPPTRWLVIRHLDVASVKPASAAPALSDDEFRGWVIESDHLWSLDQIPLDKDLQTDMAPFVTGLPGANVDIQQQAEVFIGRKTDLRDWKGVEDPKAQPPSISLLRSSNQLFADFQMHNSNVFSMLDNFQYADAKYLDYARASYYVMGWHWKQEADPLWNSGKSVAHGASLDALFLDLQGAAQGPEKRDPWLDAKSQLRLMCHGAMYDVVWDSANKPKDVPADRFAARLRDQTVPAISLGTTPMDALVSYCTARKGKGGDPEKIAKLEEDILALYSLLHARDDGVEGQREAKDAIYNWSFTRSSGGGRYHISDGDSDQQQQPDGRPLQPKPEAVQKLRDLNQAKGLLDACGRTMQQYRWHMFSCWWKYVSDVGNKNDNQQNLDFKRQTKDVSDRIAALQKRIDALDAAVDGLLHPKDAPENLLKNAKAATKPFFYRGNDPTVLVGGVDTGWATDYLDKAAVRAPYQIVTPKKPVDPNLALFVKLFPLLKRLQAFEPVARALATEFYILGPQLRDSGVPGDGEYAPQFHDDRDKKGSLRDEWADRQPWFPLYVEWEAEYTHIPFEYWKLDEHTARLSASKLVRYGVSVPSGKPLWEALPQTHDTRILSGRVLILPQPSFSLEAKVRQLFDGTPPALLDILPKEERDNLLANIRELAYLSSPLSGFTSGLTTQAQGSHIKPENKTVGPGGEASSAIGAAIFDSAGLSKSNIELIQGNSALTPYAAMVNFRNDGYCPFKPVTHGQFRFRKFNIIDKFGQALMAIDQAPQVNGPPPMYPCISDFYEPQTITLDDKKLYANTVLQDNSKLCEFLQLPPQINQNARLNADFVRRVADDPVASRTKTIDAEPAKWRPSTEWENPIWGWIITNYADYGLQLFLPDGTFYREVRFGGPLGALVAPKWIPFAPDTNDRPADTAQLDALVAKLSDPAYLNGFWHMITTAQDNLPPAPTAYAQFLNSIVGKPLALVNMGWSLELDGPPLTIQSTKSAINEPERLLTKPRPTAGGGQSKPFYEFQVRLGDVDSEYDGLVGYFDTVSKTSDVLDLGYVNTFFAPEPPDPAMKSLRRLSTATYPLFTPFWEPPFPTAPPYTPAQGTVDPATFADRRNGRMSVFGAIVDPFTPVHAYSSFLPPVALALPPWTWQAAMNTMTAFFHSGPLTLTDDVPAFDRDQLLTGRNVRDIPGRSVPLPALGAGDWSWLQPYVDPATAAVTVGPNVEPPPPVFNAFAIEKRGDLLKPGFQKGPYTAVDGFLQLRNPIMMPVEKEKPKT